MFQYHMGWIFSNGYEDKRTYIFADGAREMRLRDLAGNHIASLVIPDSIASILDLDILDEMVIDELHVKKGSYADRKLSKGKMITKVIYD